MLPRKYASNISPGQSNNILFQSCDFTIFRCPLLHVHRILLSVQEIQSMKLNKILTEILSPLITDTINRLALVRLSDDGDLNNHKTVRYGLYLFHIFKLISLFQQLRTHPSRLQSQLTGKKHFLQIVLSSLNKHIKGSLRDQTLHLKIILDIYTT